MNKYIYSSRFFQGHFYLSNFMFLVSIISTMCDLGPLSTLTIPNAYLSQIMKNIKYKITWKKWLLHTTWDNKDVRFHELYHSYKFLRKHPIYSLNRKITRFFIFFIKSIHRNDKTRKKIFKIAYNNIIG